jgi:putative acetyltransferase
MTLRPELPADAPAVHAVHAAAFPTDAEARLVDRLRANGEALVSLVADADGRIAGHVLFSPVTVTGHDASGAGLAPLAVLPEYQRQGIGADLVRAGLDACRAAGIPFAVVLGDPDYYGRFGFRRAGDYGLLNEYGADAEFMVIELVPGGPPKGGLVRYGAEFAEFGD